MKSLIRIIVLTLIALVFQHSIFLYVENVYLNSDDEIIVQKVEENEEAVEENNETISLDYSIKDAEVSDSGKYVWYMKNNKVTVLNTQNNTENTINCEDEIAYCKWKTNEDNLILFKKVKDGKEQYFEQMSYNAKKNEFNDSLRDFEKDVPKIIIEDNYKIDKVVHSPLNGIMYVKVLKDDNTNDLYYINVQNDTKRVRSDIILDDIVVPSNADKCVMQINGKITVLDSKNNIEIPNSNSVKILGTDFDNNVYFGEVNEDKISKIYFKNINDENDKWTTMVLSKSESPTDIFISTDGEIFVNDNEFKSVTELKSGKSLKYDGEFIQGIKNGFVTKQDNILTLNYFNKEEKK